MERIVENNNKGKSRLKTEASDLALRLFTLGKWIVMGLITGTVVGCVCTAFALILGWANAFRSANPAVIFALPLAGILIVFLYRVTRNTTDTGTNMVIASLEASPNISWKMAPLIFVSTVLTQLCGGSAGREGAALQIGGSITNLLSGIPALRFNENDHKVNIMCGMSAGFAALFGTPMASAVFAMEVASVGIMHYSVMVPCIISAFTAYFISGSFGIMPEAFAVPLIPQFTMLRMLQMLGFGVVLAVVANLFCYIMHRIEHLGKRITNPYIRIAASGCLIIGLSCILGTRMYLGSGVGIIEHVFEEDVPAAWYVFLLKMLFTALTIGAGFKGGEIIPSFCVGAAFGSCAAALLGLPVTLAAACGMVGVFCGVTNCPIASLLIAFEMFGFRGMPYYLVIVAVSYMFAGYDGLYHTQKIRYSKLKQEEI